MVLGDEIFSGGKALESNIVDKRLEFFKNLSDHIQIIGNRLHLSSAIAGLAAPTDTFYTVPQNRNFYIYTMTYGINNATAASPRVFLIIGNTTETNFIFNSFLLPNEVANYIFPLPIPLLLKENEKLTFEFQSAGSWTAVLDIVGYEINKEILF